MTEEQERLVLENQGLIGLAIKRIGLFDRYEELADISMIGLVEGAKKFDKTKGFKASTYLYSCIQGKIYSYLRVSNAKKRGRNYQTISLEQEVCIGDRNVCVSDLIADEKIDIEKEMIKKEQLELIKKSIKELGKKEQYVLIHKFELNNAKQMTEKEMAKNLNLSQPQINRILHKAIEKIRKNINYEEI